MKKTILSALVLGFAHFLNAQQNPVEIYRLTFPSTQSYEQGKPMLSPDGKSLYFISTYFETNKLTISQNIWKTNWKNHQTALKPELIQELSNNDNNAVVGFGENPNELFLLGSYSKKETLKTGLSSSQKIDNVWSKPEEVKIKGLNIKGDQYDLFKPEKGNVLFLSLSDKNNVLSLYVSQKDESGKWSKPTLIEALSSEENSEISPFYDETSGYLYFASNKSGGLGDMDIYRSKKLDDTWLNWSNPEHLPEPINTKSFDAYFATYGEKGAFMVSSRQDSLSSLYFIKMDAAIDLQEEIASNETANLEAKEEGIFYYSGLPKEGAVLQLLDENGDVIEEVTTGEGGSFKFSKLDTEKGYTIRMITEDGAFDPAEAIIEPVDHNKYQKLSPITTEMRKEGISDNELLAGYFKYEGLPQQGIEVVLLDEDGNILSSTFTDESGFYQFKNLDRDKVYIVKYLDKEGQFNPGNLEVYPIKKNAETAEVKPEPKVAEAPKTPEKPSAPAPTVAPKPKEPTSKPAMKADVAKLDMALHYGFNALNPNSDEWQKIKMQLQGLDKGLRIKIEGHTDNIGSDSANKEVGLKRAEAIKKQLVDLGFDGELITVESLSSSQPIAPNETPQGRAENRRVEIKVQ